MRHQQLRVTAVQWRDDPSGQKSVTFETSKGSTFTCLVDGGDVHVDEIATVVAFDYLEAEGNAFTLNPSHEHSIAQLSEWDVEIKGQVLMVEYDTGLVDCGGVVIPLYRLTSDTAVIGSWVGSVLRRLEAELA